MSALQKVKIICHRLNNFKLIGLVFALLMLAAVLAVIYSIFTVKGSPEEIKVKAALSVIGVGDGILVYWTVAVLVTRIVKLFKGK